MLTKAELPECPVATTLQLIGNKWKILILRNLMVRPWRFNEMLRSIPGISQRRLSFWVICFHAPSADIRFPRFPWL